MEMISKKFNQFLESSGQLTLKKVLDRSLVLTKFSFRFFGLCFVFFIVLLITEGRGYWLCYWLLDQARGIVLIDFYLDLLNEYSNLLKWYLNLLKLYLDLLEPYLDLLEPYLDLLKMVLWELLKEFMESVKNHCENLLIYYGIYPDLLELLKPLVFVVPAAVLVMVCSRILRQIHRK